MSKGIFETLAGAALVAVDVAFLGANPLLIEAGASLVASGIGSLLANQRKGIAANTLNPVAPWNVVYGQGRVGGTTIWQQTNGDTDKYWHRVIVLACHSCQSVDALIFDNKRVCLDTNGNSLSFQDSTAVIASQQTQNIASISRVNDVVTVIMSSFMPLPASTAAGPSLMTGDTVQISGAPDPTANGQFQILMQNETTFTYISGGNPFSGNSGTVTTQWPDYGDTVHFEVALGNQSAEFPPFPGLLASDGTGSNGTWTGNHLCMGRTAVYLRMKYGGDTYQPGIPELGFLLHGKNDIYDPRSPFTFNNAFGVPTGIYTENAALCIADFLMQQTWGYKLLLGTDVPIQQLITAANICDEQVALASGGFENRYTCNGGFQLNVGRGEILQNMLTSCAGRLTCAGGQYVINPGAWTGATTQLGTATPVNANGSPISSAVVHVFVSYTRGSSGSGVPVVAGNFGPFSNGQLEAIGQPRVDSAVLNFAFYMDMSGVGPAMTHLTYTVSQLDLLQLQQLGMVFGIEGTLLFTDDPPGSILNIYDCYIIAGFEDGTTSQIRPSAISQRNNGIFGAVTNAAFANDADTDPPVTFASVTRTQYGGAPNMGYLALSNFYLPTANTVVPTAIDLTNAAGPFVWKPKLAARDLYNGVKGTYVAPVNNFQASDFPPYAQDTDHGYTAPAGTTGYYDINVATDGERRWYDIQLPFTNSYSMAQRIAKIELMRKRQQGTGTFAFNLAMYQLTALDVVSMTIPYLPNFSNKLLEVVNHRFTVENHEEGDSRFISLGTQLDLQETDPSVYSWSTTEELSPEGFVQTQATGTQTVQSPTGVTGTSGNSVAIVSGGVAQSRVQITWSLPTDGFVLNGGYTTVQYQIAGDTSWTALGNFDPTTTTAYVTGVSDGTQYNARIAFVNAAGVQSPWVVEGPITASGPPSTNNWAYNETPTGPYDGVGTVYGVTYAPDPPSSLQLFLNGAMLLQGIDYTLDGHTITMLTYKPNQAAGGPGDWLSAYYHYASSSVGGGAGSGGGTGTGTGGGGGTGTGTGGGGTGTGGGGTGTGGGGTTVTGGPGSQMSFSNANVVQFADGLNTTNVAPLVWDNNGNLIGYTSAQIVDANNATVTFANPQTGTVKLTPTVYQQSFSNSTSVSVAHNLNTMNIIPVVFDANHNVIGFNTFTLSDPNNATLTFSKAQAGSIQILDPTTAYSQSFTSQNSVSVTHNLGVTLVAAAVYNTSNVLIGYNTFGPVTNMTSQLTFAAGNTQSGRVVVIAPGSTGNVSTSVADQIYADMTGTNEGHPHGVPSSYDFYNGPVIGVGNNLGSNTALEWWSALYVDAGGNPASNTQIAVKNVQLWWLNTSTNAWVSGVAPTSTFDGGYYAEDFSGSQLSSVPFTSESDGSTAYGTTVGEVAHCFTPFPRVPVDNTHFGGVVCLAEAQLVLINPTGTDDRASAKLLFGVGCDPYPDTTSPGADNITGVVGGKFKYVTTAWRSFAATTLTKAQLESNPPPIDLTGIAG